MENYIYNLGAECAKIMNNLYSINTVYSAMTSFISGNTLVLNSKAISSFKNALPQSISGLTGPLFLQGNIAKSLGSNLYLGVTGSSINSGISAKNDTRYTRLTQSLSGSTIVLNPSFSYEIVSAMKSHNFEPSFYLNTSGYDDDGNFVFISVKDGGVYNNSFLGYTADSYNTHFGQTPFGNLLETYGKQVTGFFNYFKDELQPSFEDLVLNMANFANISYSNQDCKDNFFDLSENIISAFQEFAKINLNV